MPRGTAVPLRNALLVLALLAFSTCKWRAEAPAPPPPAPTPTAMPEPKKVKFEATAYSLKGITADGSRTREGIVAADPRVLPLGTRIRVHGAGNYSGVYVVRDTGRTIKGREIDIYVPDNDAAREFGRRTVEVEILK